MKENLYVKNKLRLEKYIREMCSKFLIVRVSNLVGPGGNKRNIFNYSNYQRHYDYLDFFQVSAKSNISIDKMFEKNLLFPL